MRRIFKLFGIATFYTSLVLILFCSENPHELTVNILDGQFQGSVKDTVIYVSQDTSYSITTKVSTRNSVRLLIGEADGLTAHPIIRFTDFAGIPDTAVIDSAWIKLYANGYISTATSTNLPFNATVFPVDSAWISNTDAVWDDVEQNIDRSKPLGETDISPGDTSEYVFELNSDGLDLVRTWADTATTAANIAGVYIDFMQADFLQYLLAISPGSSLPDPQLILSYSIPGDTTGVRDTLNANFDAFIYEGNLPQEPDRNYVSSLIEYNTILKFNLKEFVNGLPENISLISANIQIPIDLEKSLVDERYGLNPQVGLRLVSAFTNDSVEVDSASGRFTIISTWSSDSGYVEINSNDNRRKLALLIRDILNINDSSEGFVISFLGSTSTGAIPTPAVDFYSYLAYFTHRETSPERKARIVLTYWVPAESRL